MAVRARSHRDTYIRPPLVASEPPSARAARTRFRVAMVLMLAAIAVGAFFLARALLSSGEGNPSLGSSPATSVRAVVALLPP